MRSRKMVGFVQYCNRDYGSLLHREGSGDTGCRVHGYNGGFSCLNQFPFFSKMERRFLFFKKRRTEHRRIERLRQQAWLVVVVLQDSGMRPDEVFPMQIVNIYWDQNRIWVPEGKTDNATRFVPMSECMKNMLRAWCGSRKEGWVFPSTRSKSGHLTTIAKGFQAARGRAGLDKKLVPYSARHTYGTYTMEKSGNAFAVSKSMGHADLKSMEPYQHQELEPLRVAINQRNRRKKFGQVFGQVLENAS